MNTIRQLQSDSECMEAEVLQHTRELGVLQVQLATEPDAEKRRIIEEQVRVAVAALTEAKSFYRLALKTDGVELGVMADLDESPVDQAA